MAEQGSSPLARGLQANGLSQLLTNRIIPARAGFTLGLPRRRGGGRDHPRSRGVYASVGRVTSRVTGSSPLARGLRASRTRRSIRPGIIPARAGFTRPQPACRIPQQDHPRSRGVYRHPHRRRSPPGGSSPLARGLPGRQYLAVSVGGIIPARAGFTQGHDRHFHHDRDHPRSRGVYSRGIGLRSGSPGSSPLARGLLADPVGSVLELRIIPARAGFTRRPACSTRWHPDHPRSRGVYPLSTVDTRSTSGSSPLARGLRGANALVRRESRDHPRSRGVYSTTYNAAHLHSWIIPARAGFTGGPRSDTGRRRGSSPLARGLREIMSDETKGRRIIPARAGFTLADPWNPNEPTLYQTPAAFTADLGPAPPGRDSAVEFGAALSAAGRAGRDLVAAGLRSRFDTHRRVATTSG